MLNPQSGKLTVSEERNNSQTVAVDKSTTKSLWRRIISQKHLKCCCECDATALSRDTLTVSSFEALALLHHSE